MDKLTKRIQELTDEINTLMVKREDHIAAIHGIDLDVSNKTAVIIELKRLIESSEQSGDSDQEKP